MGQGGALSDDGEPLGSDDPPLPTRRRVIAGAAGLALPAARVGSLAAVAALVGGLAGCRTRSDAYDGGWVGAAHERGHLLRDGGAALLRERAAASASAGAAAGAARRADVVIVGAGIAGLGAARTLAQAGIDDIQLLELEDGAGGNSRGHTMAGLRCPLGAHYLPLPGPAALEVAELLDALGIRTTASGQPRYDERMLCHSPQERLYIGGGWRDGLLPPLDALPAGERARTQADYAAFARAVTAAASGGAFAIPTARSRWSPALDALDAISFATWLDTQQLGAPALRWYLDYCCRDDYGAGSAQVSAWAGLHYFASRHGFRPGGDEPRDAGEGLLAWPEGNAWLSERMAAPFAARLQRARIVLRVDEDKDGIDIDCWDAIGQRRERWRARAVVLATPLFIAARLLSAPPAALREAAPTGRHAPWLVANLLLREPLQEHPGAPLSWDNVIYGSEGLGYVDAMHQSLLPYAGRTVLTAYRALGGDTAEALLAGRRQLLADDWRRWAERVVGELERAHPDLRQHLERVDLMRYGHAMSVPTPGRRSSPALRALADSKGRVQFAHSDLSAYSVFEEALYHGVRAGRAVAAQLRS